MSHPPTALTTESGFRRLYAHDPFGNRLEFLQPLPPETAGGAGPADEGRGS